MQLYTHIWLNNMTSNIFFDHINKPQSNFGFTFLLLWWPKTIIITCFTHNHVPIDLQTKSLVGDISVSRWPGGTKVQCNQCVRLLINICHVQQERHPQQQYVHGKAFGPQQYGQGITLANFCKPFALRKES